MSELPKQTTQFQCKDFYSIWILDKIYLSKINHGRM